MSAPQAIESVQMADGTIVQSFMEDHEAYRSAPTNLSRLPRLADQRATLSAKKPAIGGTHENDFKDAMRHFKANSSNRTIVENFDIGTARTWDEVVGIAQRATRKYNDEAKGKRGILRRMGRSSVEYTEMVQNLTEFIPDGDYSGVLSGALTFICNAASVIKERREQVFEALAGIPETILAVEQSRETFYRDKVLQDRTIDFYVSILVAVDAMTTFLLQKCPVKILAASVKGPLFEKNLVETIKNIPQYHKRVSSRISILGDKTSVDIQTGVGRLETGISRQNDDLRDIKSGQQTIKDTLDEQEQSMREYYQGLLNVLLSGIIRDAPWKPSPEELRQAFLEASAMAPKSSITREELSQILAIDAQADERDINLMLRNGMAEDESCFNVLHGIVRDTRFRSWLSRKSSEVLLIEDNTFAMDQSRVTALSIFCASLCRSLREDHYTLSIQFFCSLHSLSTDSQGGAVALMKGLIQQLLFTSGYSFDLSIVNSQQRRVALEAGDLYMLCEVFTKLVHQLPPAVALFCFIDGLSSSPSSTTAAAYEQDTAIVVRALQQLTHDSELNSVFKLLITDFARDGQGAYDVSPADRLILSRHLDFEGYDLTERELMAQMQRPVDPFRGLGRQHHGFGNVDEESSSEGGDEESEHWRQDFLKEME